MMKTNLKIVTGSLASVLLALSGNAQSSGFALIEQSGSGLGNAYAGGAASAEDASTVFFNPAGMSRLEGKQVVAVIHVIDPSVTFTDGGSTAVTAPAPRPLGTSGVDAGSLAFVPNGYFTMEVNPKMHFGIGVNVPFGLETDYPAGWIGRFQALKSSIETLNVNPSLSYQVSDTISIGAGINYQKVEAELTSARNLGASEGLTTLQGNDDAWGYNFGVLMDLPTGGRLGVAYRSSIDYTLEGTVAVTNAAGVLLAAPTAITADLETPDTLSLSYFQALNDKWDVMADISRTGWSSFQELRIKVASSGATLQVTPENWSDTWRYSVGANYHYDEKWLARLGVAFDQAPVSDVDRTARIPDNDRTWLALGGQYKPNKASAIDFGYAHLFVKDSTINNNTGAAGTPSPATVGNLVGTYNNSVDIVSVQYTYGF